VEAVAAGDPQILIADARDLAVERDRRPINALWDVALVP
jgi:hypothetical protein